MILRTLIIIWAVVIPIVLCSSKFNEPLFQQYWEEITYPGNFMSTLDQTPYDVFSEGGEITYGSFQPDKIFGILTWQQYIDFLKRTFPQFKEKRFTCSTINPRDTKANYTATGNFDKKTGPFAFAMTYFYHEVHEMDSIVYRGDLNEKYIFKVRFDDKWNEKTRAACFKTKLQDTEKTRLANPFFVQGMNFREVVEIDGRTANQYWMSATENNKHLEYFLSFEPDTGLPVETIELIRDAPDVSPDQQESDLSQEEPLDLEDSEEGESDEPNDEERPKEEIKKYVSRYTCLTGDKVTNEFLTKVIQPVPLCSCSSIEDERDFWLKMVTAL